MTTTGSLQFGEEFEAFLTGRGIAGVVEIDEGQRIVALFDRLERRAGRLGGVDEVAFGFEQEAEGFQHIGLVIGDEDTAGRRGVRGHWGSDG